jgi:hypothetical protein
MHTKFWLENLKGKDHLRWEDAIRMDLGEIVGGFGLDLCGSGQGPVVGSHEHSNDPSGPMKRKEFLEQLSDS